MPQCTHTTVVHAPLAPTWAFVREMDNWAPLLTGYQGHDKRDDKTSVWRLKGDVGMLSREVALRVEITEWLDAERVSFTLVGEGEAIDGDGTFSIRSVERPGSASSAPPSAIEDAPVAQPTNPFTRLIRWLFAALFRRQHGQTAAIEAPAAASDVELTFVLRMDAGGPMAPMVNALLEPALQPATEELATRIANRIHELHGAQA